MRFKVTMFLLLSVVVGLFLFTHLHEPVVEDEPVVAKSSSNASSIASDSKINKSSSLTYIVEASDKFSKDIRSDLIKDGKEIINILETKFNNGIYELNSSETTYIENKLTELNYLIEQDNSYDSEFDDPSDDVITSSEERLIYTLNASYESFYGCYIGDYIMDITDAKISVGIDAVYTHDEDTLYLRLYNYLINEHTDAYTELDIRGLIPDYEYFTSLLDGPYASKVIANQYLRDHSYLSIEEATASKENISNVRVKYTVNSPSDGYPIEMNQVVFDMLSKSSMNHKNPGCKMLPKYY